MAYQYEWDNKVIGDLDWPAAPYRLVQEGLRELMKEVERWNQVAVDHGWRVPYQQEADRLTRMIQHGDDLLAKDQYFVHVSGVTVGSLSYLRAGLELTIFRRRRELAAHRQEGWPGGVLRGLEAKDP